MQPQKTKRHEQVSEKSVLQKRDYLRTSFYREKKGWEGRGAPAQKSWTLNQALEETQNNKKTTESWSKTLGEGGGEKTLNTSCSTK